VFSGGWATGTDAGLPDDFYVNVLDNVTPATPETDSETECAFKKFNRFPTFFRFRSHKF